MNVLALMLGGLLRGGGHRHTGGGDGPVLASRDVPVGAICLYDGDTAPATWALCDGTSGAPDLRDRFIRGAASDGELGALGGAPSANLLHQHGGGGLLTDSPSHSHTGSITIASPTLTFGVNPGGMGAAGTGHTHNADTTGAATHNHFLTGGSELVGGAQDTRPPYYAARYIMRAARQTGAKGTAPGFFAALLARLLTHTHADDAAASFGLPVGAIVPFRGAYGGWPGNFALCDGASGTPDLRSRFVVGAGASYARGTTGGASTMTFAHAHTAGTFTGAANATHTHTGSTSGLPFANAFSASDNPGSTNDTASELAADHAHGGYTTDGGGSHTHAVSGSLATATVTASNLPAYYQVAFLKRVS